MRKRQADLRVGRTKWRNSIWLSHAGFTIVLAALLVPAAIVLWSTPEVGTTVMRPLSFGHRAPWPASTRGGSALLSPQKGVCRWITQSPF